MFISRTEQSGLLNIHYSIPKKAALADRKRNHDELMMAATLMWARATEKREQPKVTLKIDKMNQNDEMRYYLFIKIKDKQHF